MSSNRMIDWKNFIVSSIMFDRTWQSNYCMLFELVGFPSVRLDISCILIHCSTWQDEMCKQMFLKDIRDNILSMHLIALSSSMKTSLSDFFFFHTEFFEVLFFLFCYVLDSLMLKNFNSWILRFFFNSLLLKHVYLFAASFELSSRQVLSAWLSVWLPFVRSFVALSRTKS